MIRNVSIREKAWGSLSLFKGKKGKERCGRTPFYLVLG